MPKTSSSPSPTVSPMNPLLPSSSYLKSHHPPDLDPISPNPSPCSYLLHVDADDEALIQFPSPNPSSGLDLGSAVASPPPINPTPHISSQFYTFTAASHALMLRCVLAGRPAAAEEVRAATSPSVLASWRGVWKDRNEDTAYLTAWKCIQDKLAASADGRHLHFKSNPAQRVSHVGQWRDIVSEAHTDQDLLRHHSELRESGSLLKAVVLLSWLDADILAIHDCRAHLRAAMLLPKYRNLHFERLKCVGVVVDSREANNILKIKQLLRWFSTIGVKYVVLYDIEGVLKESLEPGIEALKDEKSRTYLDHSAHGGMAIECLSGSDGKEGIAKAANLLCSEFCNFDTHEHNKSGNSLTEADMACALRAVGSGGPEPDLLLVYGPVRCHLGFPAWRLRFTEIMHMGSLKSMKYGSVVKALHRFSQKFQNYGK